MTQETTFTCESAGCNERAVFHINWVESRHCSAEQHLCDEHARPVLVGLDFRNSIGPGTPAITDGARCFDIALVVISEVHDQQVVYLREVGGIRFLPLLTGIFEATSLNLKIKGFYSPRPLTHDAMLNVIQSMGGEIQDVLVEYLKDQIYYATLRIRQSDQLVLIDMRPSDAFSLALLADKPIFVADKVLTQID